MTNRDQLPYRQSTVAIITNKDGNFLIVNKSSYKPDNEWAFPGGGVDEGETPEKAVKRELTEELMSDKFEVIGKSKYEYQYEWPEHTTEEMFQKHGIYFRGTQLTQFRVKFTGEQEEVKPGDGIRSVKWVTRDELKTHLIFPNQWENVEKVILEFENKQ